MRLRETRADAKRMAFCVCASNGHIGEPKGRGCGGDLDDWWQAKDLLGRIGTRRGAAGLKVDGARTRDESYTAGLSGDVQRWARHEIPEILSPKSKKAARFKFEPRAHSAIFSGLRGVSPCRIRVLRASLAAAAAAARAAAPQ